MGASSSGGAGPSTRGTLPTDASSQYACKDLVSRLSAKKLGFILREYKLGYLPCWATRDERPHLPPPGYMAISEGILKTRVFSPLHSFIDQVLECFDIVLFQLSPNSYHLIMAFYIAFSELCKTASSVRHVIFIFRLKALAKHPGFWYLTGRGYAARILGLRSNVGQVAMIFFSFLLSHSLTSNV